MANWDNHATKQTEEEMLLRYDLGIVEGYEGMTEDGDETDQDLRKRKAAEAVAKLFREFSPYQRGYVFGYLLRLAD